MAEYLIQDTTLTAIGNAIRNKEGSSDVIPVNDMASRIEAIESGGTPVISVDSSGLITATVGEKRATVQLDSSIDADFIAENIKSGINLFGVDGSCEIGVDTSDATAYATSIWDGYTAYARGEKLVGTCGFYNPQKVTVNTSRHDIIAEYISRSLGKIECSLAYINPNATYGFAPSVPKFSWMIFYSSDNSSLNISCSDTNNKVQTISNFIGSRGSQTYSKAYIVQIQASDTITIS